MRTIKIPNVIGKVNEKLTAKVRLLGGGEVAAFSFSLTFDPSLLAFESADLAGAVPAGMNLATNDTATGIVGVLVDGVTPYAKTRGYQDVVTLTFSTLAVGKSTLQFTDNPVQQFVSTTQGVLLKTKFVSGTVTVKS